MVENNPQIASDALALPDVELAEHQREILGHFRAKSTYRSYRFDWAKFSEWCSTRGVTPETAPSKVITLYLTALEKASMSRSTIERALAGISFVLKASGREDWPFRGYPKDVQIWLESFRRKRKLDKVKDKSPIRLSELRRLVATCDDSMRGTRDRALLLLGWDGCFRRSELAALEVRDLDFVEGGETVGLVVKVRASKTDQEGKGDVKSVFYANDPSLCSILSVKAWLEKARIMEGPLFRMVPPNSELASARGLKGATVADIVKRRCELAGLNPKEFSGHSLRSGFITQGALQNEPVTQLQEQAGHKSLSTTLRYYKEANALHRVTVGKRMK